jgi:uncharacterized protein (TIGR03067 family)
MDMARCLVLVLLLTNVSEERDSDQDATKRDLDRVQGKWRLVTAITGGQTGDITALPGKGYYVFGRKSFDVVEEKDGVEKHLGATKFTLRVQGQQRELDTFNADGTIIARCIYSMFGDEFKLCGNEGERPTEFKTEPSSRAVIYIMKRVKE